MTKQNIHYYRDENLEIKELLAKGIGDQHRLTLSKDIPQDTEMLILAYPTREKLSKLTNLKYLVIPFVGIPQATSELMRDFPKVKLFNIHHNSRPVAENVMAFILAGIKHIIPADREFRKHDWSIRYQENPSSLLYKKKVLICGYGHIGKLLEAFLLPYDLQIDKIKRKGTNSVEGIYSLKELNSIISNYDIIINLLPATNETKDIFNQTTFKNMKTNAFFVNVGRASTVDEQALFQALESKSIAGAALDVWYNYPKTMAERQNTQPANYPFNSLDNVIMSPHRAGGLGMVENELFRIEELIKLIKLIQNEPDLQGIDLDIGY